jgi:hypothetical protein
MMMVVQSGEKNLNTWVSEERNIYADYRKAFKDEPPMISGVAIMTETDNTGESATAYYGDIMFRKEGRLNQYGSRQRIRLNKPRVTLRTIRFALNPNLFWSTATGAEARGTSFRNTGQRLGVSIPDMSGELC